MAYRWITLLVTAALGTVLIAPAMAQSPVPAKETALLSIATKVAVLENVSNDTYFWITDYKVLFFRQAPLPISNAEKKKLSRRHPLPKDFLPPYFKLYAYDTQTSKLLPIDLFNTKYAPTLLGDETEGYDDEDGRDPTIIYRIPSCMLSPDGQWFVWYSTNLLQALRDKAHKFNIGWTTAKLDGTGAEFWTFPHNLSDSGPPVWERDNRHWLEVYESYVRKVARFSNATIYDLSAPAIPREITMDSPENGLVEGVDSDGSVLVVDLDFRHDNIPPKIEQFDLSGASATRKVFAVQPPVGYQSESDVALSPAGDKLAWIFNNKYDIVNADANGTYILCISDTDGSHMQVIGSMQGYLAPKTVNHQLYYWPETLRWTPDGKHISFIFRNALYTVPAP